MPTAFDRKEAERLAAERIERQFQAVNHPAQKNAMAQLKALAAVPGALLIITNEPDPKAPPVLPQHPHYWVAHAVTRIEGPDHNGNVWAYSKEGDHCHGTALALLGRLTQYSRAAAFEEERQEVPARGRQDAAMRVDRPLK